MSFYKTSSIVSDTNNGIIDQIGSNQSSFNNSNDQQQQQQQSADRSISIGSDTSSSYQTLKDDNDKLNKRLLLLRDEYVKLQKKYMNLQTRYDQLLTTQQQQNKFLLTSANSLDSYVADSLTSSNDQSSPPSTTSLLSSSATAITAITTNNNTNNTTLSSSITTTTTTASCTGFVQKIVHFIGSLFNNDLYSDLLIYYEKSERKFFAHKFVLLFRSDRWSVPDLNQVDKLCFDDMPHSIAEPLFRWVYTGYISDSLFDQSEDFILEFVKYAVQFDLKPLVEQCEESLISYVQKHNCVYFYQTSEQLGLTRLCDYSAKLVSVNWDSLVEKDFKNVSTPFLHRLFVEKSRYPLHKAIRIRNEDLIFLLLMDFDQQTSFKVNEFDNFNHLPLDLALRYNQFSVAKTLLDHQANINSLDSDGWPLAHRYLSEKLWQQARFLLEQNVSIQLTNNDGDSLLHLCADCSDKSDNDQIIDLACLLFDRKCDVNFQNKIGQTALHRSIIARNFKFFDLLLSKQKQFNLNLELSDSNHQTPLSLALCMIDDHDEQYFAEKLLSLNVSMDTVHPINGDSLLNQCARKHYEKAAVFLVEQGANINLVNNHGESILHLAASQGLEDLVSILLHKNVNCNLLTTNPPSNRKIMMDKLESDPSSSDSMMKSNDDNDANDDDEIDWTKVYNQTALHLAIIGKHEKIIAEILSFHHRSSRKGRIDSALFTADLEIKNSLHQTPLCLAIELNLISIAEMLISAGANIDVKDEKGLSLLHKTIMKGNIIAAQFLLEHGLDITQSCPLTGESYLQYAIRYHQAPIVEMLCELGADLKQLSTNGDSLLWEALKLYKETGDVEIASILIRNNIDPDGWHRSVDSGFNQTLLHRALDENNQDAAIFLIHSGCDIHAIRKPGPNGEGQDDCDGQTPLHMACSWSMGKVVSTLLEYQVDANLTDNEGKTALHVAIINQNHPIIEMLLLYPGCDPYKSDNYGHTPFSLAIKLKSRQTALDLVDRDPMIAEQRDGKGRNYLHLALQRNDYDSVLFLLDIKVNVNARIQDSSQKAPIHLAAETGSEIILRTLVLAGSELNVWTVQNQSGLHLAAELNKYQIVETLFDLGIDPSVQDNNGNSAFHLAAIKAHHNTCLVLIGRWISMTIEDRRPCLDIRQINNRGHNVVHCLAISSNKAAAACIFDEIVAHYRNSGIDGHFVDLDARDAEGHTALLLAYMNGNGKLCRSLVKEGASLGIRNNQGVSIFNHVMPTRQLLTSLLDSLTRMPSWRDGPECLECGQKFNITNRRHHCRHCGRELCSRCSSKEMVIMKFQNDRKSMQSRVCELCYEVLTLGIFN